MNYTNWSVLNRSELAALYDQYSGTDIAQMFNVDPGTVYSRMRSHGIKAGLYKSGTPAKCTIPEDELRRLYSEMSVAAIARMHDCPFNAVRHRLRALGIETAKRGSRRRFNPDPDELKTLFQTKSMREIARHYGVGETVVFNRLKEHGITGPSRAERLSKYAKARPPSHNKAIAESLSKLTGPLGNNWRGGVSKEAKLARTRKEYHAWKRAVIAASGYVCQQCGVEQGHVCGCCGSRTLLHAHHIKPFSDNEALRYDVSNGIALCGRCHREEHFGKVGELLETP